MHKLFFLDLKGLAFKIHFPLALYISGMAIQLLSLSNPPKDFNIHFHEDVIPTPCHKYSWKCLLFQFPWDSVWKTGLFNTPYCKWLWHPPEHHNMCEEMRVSGMSSEELRFSSCNELLQDSTWGLSGPPFPPQTARAEIWCSSLGWQSPEVLPQ